MNKICAVLVLFISLCITGLVYAAPPTKAKKMTYWQNGTVTKSLPKATRVSTRYCMATAFMATGSDEGSDQLPTVVRTETYFAAPAFCMSGMNGNIGFQGDFDELSLIGVAQGLVYFKALAMRHVPYPNVRWDMAAGDEVLVYSDQSIEITVGKETVVAYPADDVYISANVSGSASYTEHIHSTCNASGCTSSQEDMGWGYVFLDKEFKVPPGSALISMAGQSVGMFMGSDQGQSLAVSIGTMFEGAVKIGIIENGKG